MSNRDAETQHVLGLQADMFRLAKRDYALSYKRLSLLSGIPDTTIESWAKGVSMPVSGLVKLLPHVPDELTSLLLEPAGKHVGTNETDDGDLDALGREAAGFVAEKLDREADGTVCHIDKAALKSRARRVAGVARAAAA